MVLGKKTLF